MQIPWPIPCLLNFKWTFHYFWDMLESEDTDISRRLVDVGGSSSVAVWTGVRCFFILLFCVKRENWRPRLPIMDLWADFSALKWPPAHKGQLEGLMEIRAVESEPCFFAFFGTSGTVLREMKASTPFSGTVCLKLSLFLKKSELW